MRVISQDGMIDIPYECAFMGIDYRNNRRIYANGANWPDDVDGMTMANYSTPEKAKRAMEMLYETYIDCNVFCSNIIEGHGGLKSAYIKNDVFRFPQEDKI